MTHRFNEGDSIRVRPGSSLAIRGQAGIVTRAGPAIHYYRIKLSNGRRGLIVSEDDLELLTEEEQFESKPANLLDHW